MVGILGVTFLVSLSGNNLIKGLAAGGLGFYLATVGMDPMSATQRYTFGFPFLWDGIGLVPVRFRIARHSRSNRSCRCRRQHRQKSGKLGGVMEGIKDTFRHFWLVVRVSALGGFI